MALVVITLMDKLTNIEQLADQYNVIVVNPDGNFGSWYLDSEGR